METKNLLLITFFGLLTIFELKAQQCGTPQTTNLPLSQRTIINQNFLNNNESICFNVFYHIVRQNDGSGGFNASLLNEVTDKLNIAFNAHYLNVNNLGYDYIDNSTYYNIDDSGGNNSEFNALVQINNNPNAINIYIVNNAVSYAGRANGILSQALVIESSWANTQVMSHEVGHCLDLWHTFQGTATNTSGCAEAIDGSNCTTCGDYVCDTPADANTGNSGGYTPNMDNIMSYYYPFDEFSNGQIQRVRNAFASSSILQQIVSNSCTIAELSPIDYLCNPTNETLTISNLGNNTTNWQVSPNVTILSSNNGSITIRAKYSNSSGDGWVKATLSNGVILQEDFWVGLPDNYLTWEEIQETSRRTRLRFDIEDIITQGINRIVWEKIDGNAGFIGSGNRAYIYWSTRGYSWVRIKVTLTNDCGSTILDRFIYPSSNNRVSAVHYFKIYPNPSSESVTIQKKSNDINSVNGNKNQYELFDLNSNLIFKDFVSNDKAIIDVSNLKKGRYILKIYGTKEEETHHIIVK